MSVSSHPKISSESLYRSKCLLKNGLFKCGLKIFCCFLLLGQISTAKAEDKVQVTVRLLQASDRSMLGFSSFMEHAIDPQLIDLKEQLNVLPFESFTVLNTQKISLPIKKKDSLELANGHNLILKALSIDGNQVSLWLKWKDESGQCLLDTRMHFNSSEAMLAGTDHNIDSGLLLAVNVKPLAKID